MVIQEKVIREFLRVDGQHLCHREGQELEFKEQFNLAGLAEYFRDFAGFANNRGGYILLGISDRPRTPVGLNANAVEQFEKIDPEKISGFLLEIFSSDIRWHQQLFTIDGKSFGAFKIEEAAIKPIIAKKDEGKDQIIKNGEIYYRYGGRTQKIQHAELELIISKRIEQNNNQWLDLMKKIGRAGPSNAAILDTEKSLIEKNDSRILVLDDSLAKKLKFVKEGQFSLKKGGTALKLVGDVVPVDKVEVIKKVKENLIKDYPYSAAELAAAVKKQVPAARQNAIWDAIKENDLKNNRAYSAYNFRNKMHEDNFNQTGKLPSITPSIYNDAAVEFLSKVISNSLKKENQLVSKSITTAK
jgi:Schlafen, AlbA_2